MQARVDSVAVRFFYRLEEGKVVIEGITPS